MLKFGANIWSIPRDKRNVNEFLKKAREIGYEGVELAIDESDLAKPDMELRKKWSEISALAKNLGLEIPSVASGLYWKYNMVTDEDGALKVLRKECAVADILGARVVLVIPGVAVPELDYLEHFERVKKVLKQASLIAKEYGVTIGLEPVWNRLFPSPLEYLRIIEEVREDNIRVYFDVGNTLPHSLPEHWIRVLGNYIVQIHVKDFNMDKLEFGIPGTGSVNWAEVRKALQDIGYQGYLVAELPWDTENPYRPLTHTLTKLNELFR